MITSSFDMGLFVDNVRCNHGRNNYSLCMLCLKIIVGKLFHRKIQIKRTNVDEMIIKIQ